MLEKNIKKLKRKNRDTWSPYFQRVIEDKRKKGQLSRKQKHKKAFKEEFDA